MSSDDKGSPIDVTKNIMNLVSFFKEPLKRIWHAITQEKINELKIEGATKVFIKSLENKNFQIKAGKAKVSIKELEKEPKQVASQLLCEFRKIN